MTVPDTGDGRRGAASRKLFAMGDASSARAKRWSRVRSFLPFPAPALPLFLLLIPLYLWMGLGNRDLWAPDEPRYALVASEMRETGTWSLPSVNGEVYAHKPPLLFWSIALSSAVLGVDASDSFAARLPSALAAVGTLALTLVLGSWYFGVRTGLLGCLILATCHMFCWEAHHAQIDSLLTFWITAAVFFLACFRRTGEVRYGWAFHLACSMATLAKGPVGFVIPWAVALLTHEKRSADRRTGHRLFNASGIVLFVTPLTLWLGFATWHGGMSYISQLLGRHVVQRYVDSWHHIRPLFYFFYNTPINMVPWGVLLPAAFVFAYKHRKDPELREGQRLMLAWALFMLVLFSIPKGKRGLYMLPALPPLSVLIASCLLRMEESAMQQKAVRTLLILGFGVLTLMPIGAFFHLPQYLAKELEAAAPDAIIMRITLVAGFVFMLSGWIFGGIRALTQATLAMALTTFLGLYGSFLPIMDSHKSARALSKVAISRLEPGEELGFYKHLLEAYVLYSGRKLKVAEGPKEMIELSQRHPKLLMLLREEHLPELMGVGELDVRTLTDVRVGGKGMILARVRRLAGL